MIVAQGLANLIARGADAGEVRGGLHRRLARHALDERVGALPGRAAGAVSDGDEGGIERLEARGGLPQVRLHLRRLRREKLERDMDLGAGAAQGKGLHRPSGKLRVVFWKSSEITRGSSAIHSATVSLPDSPLAGGTRSMRMAVKARLGEIVLDLVDPEAEPAVGEFIAQEFLVVGVEIDHHEPSAGRERARLLQRAREPDRRGSAEPGG